MRKIVLVVAMIAGLVGSGAAIALAKEGNSELKRQPSPEAVVAEHLDALNHCNVDRLMAQYPESVHLLLPGGSAPNNVIGRPAVRALFEGLMYAQVTTFGAPPLKFKP